MVLDHSGVRCLHRDFEVHPLTAAAVTAAGIPGTDPAIYGEHAQTQADLAKVFEVNERTVRVWRAAGCPGRTDLGYSIPHTRVWRQRNQQPDEHVDQRGELMKGLLRVFRHEIVIALSEFAEATEVDDPYTRVLDFVTEQLAGLVCLSDADIDQVVSEMSTPLRRRDSEVIEEQLVEVGVDG